MRQFLLSLAGMLPLCALLPGCTTFGTNVSGSFRCDAPDGVCAPASTIDDEALSQIVNDARSGFASPAVSYIPDDGAPIATMPRRGSISPTPQSARSEHVRLSVVFPAYTDLRGIDHERSVTSVDAALPGQSTGSVELRARSRGLHGATSLLSVAQSAPVLEVAALSARPDVSGPMHTVSRPGPIERIQAETASITAKRAGAQASTFPGQE